MTPRAFKKRTFCTKKIFDLTCIENKHGTLCTATEPLYEPAIFLIGNQAHRLIITQ